MRSTLALVLVSLAACWNGAEALHKPCTKDDHCGRGQACLDDHCDGCDLPTPTTCDPTQRAAMRTVEASELKYADFSRTTAVVAGDFVGDARVDVAVLSFDTYAVFLFENAGIDHWRLAATYSPTSTTELIDLAAVELDGDDTTEFLVLSITGHIDVVNWDGTANLTPVETLDLPTTDLFSFAAADLVGDARLDVVVSGSTAVHVLPNVDGELDDDRIKSVSGVFYEPWDTLVVGAGASARILVPVSNDASTDGTPNQAVEVLRVDGEGQPTLESPLATDFENPWAVAEGDFLGEDELEIAVADRRLNVPSIMEGTTQNGQLRFFRLVDDAWKEVAQLEVGIGPGVLAAADLDCDGKTDLVLGNSGAPETYEGRAQVLFGSCRSTPSADDLLTFPDVGATGVGAGTRMATGDFDGDGLIEVAIPDFGDFAVDGSGRRLVFVGVRGAP